MDTHTLLVRRAMNLTRAQRVALKKVYDRQPIDAKPMMLDGYYGIRRKLSYRQFRRTVQPGCRCIMVPWCGMWLGIEPDGYIHS